MLYSDNNLDKFFTNSNVAEFCVKKALKIIPKKNRETFVEPSAGGGVFLQFLDNFIAFDIDPIGKNIIKQNFLDLEKIDYNQKNTTIIGNPPFGSCSNLAIKFFNKSAEFGCYIAFIVPKTFRKISVHNKLNKYFHLINDIDIPDDSFVYNGDKYSVPCCFQIWQKKDFVREKPVIKNDIIDFVTKDDAQFAIRRVGGRAGKILDGLDYNANSTYFCRAKNYDLLEKIKTVLQNTDFSNIVNSTAVVRSLSKQELIMELNKHNIINIKYD